MFSCEQDHTAAARSTFTNTGYQPCAAPRSLQPAAHRPGHGQHQVLPAAAAAAVQPRRAKNKKHGASRPSSSRRSSTTVVATDVNNFRAMVQELTGFPPAAIFRPLPRRVHASSPFVSGGGGGNAGQGCSGTERHARGSSDSTAAAGRGGSPGVPATLPVMAQPPPPSQCAPVLGVFDGLTDLGSPEFDSWGDFSIE